MEHAQEALVLLTMIATTVINLMALAVIAFGTVEAFLAVIRFVLKPTDAQERRVAWIRFARWLVAGLTFQLAADILATAIAPSWDDIGKLAAIAVIRTALNFSLERDAAAAAREMEAGAKPEATATVA